MTPEASAAFAIIPPAFAILVEALTPVSEKSIHHSAERDLAAYEHSSQEQHDLLITYATKMTSGAVEVSGLAPTLVAAVTSGFGALYEVPNAWLIMSYILIIMALVLLVLSYLSGNTFGEIDDKCPPLKIFFFQIPLPWSGSKGVSGLIYAVNVLLILFVLVVFWLVKHQPAPPHAADHSPFTNQIVTAV
jgi:hypothetical protein